MRIDSCRNCGNQLAIKKNCDVCLQPLQFHCLYCSKYAEDPIHTECNSARISIT